MTSATCYLVEFGILDNKRGTRTVNIKVRTWPLDILGCVLIVLKLLGRIHISWLWACMPFIVGWGGSAIALVIGLVVFRVFSNRMERRFRR